MRKSIKKCSTIKLVHLFLDGIQINTIYQQRRTKLMKELQSQHVQDVLLFDPATIFYLTGFLSEPHERFMALFMSSEKDSEHLFVPALDEDAAKKDADISSILPISDDENPYDIFKNTVNQLSNRLGIEGKVLKYNDVIHLQQLFPPIQFTDIQPELSKQRMKKSPEEIQDLLTAIHLIEKVLEEGITLIKPGMTEIEVTAELEYLMRKFGADGPSFSTIVLTGENAALPHGVPGETKIEEGDFLLIDFGVIKNGYCSDITRTFAIGDVSQQHRDLYQIVLESTNAGIEAVKSGVPLKDIDQAARDVIEKSGYGKYFNNRIGHGLGIEVHEEPSVHGANEASATEGMVFTIEPGIYIPGDVGIRIEDNVYINEEGNVEVLTSFPKTLQQI